MSTNTALGAVTSTGTGAVVGVATFSFLGVAIPTFSFIMAVTMSILVRLWVGRRSAKKHISLRDNILLSSITVIISVAIVVEYQLSFFWSVMVSAGISFSGEAILITASNEVMGVIKDSFQLLKKRMGISGTEEGTKDAQEGTEEESSTPDAPDTKDPS